MTIKNHALELKHTIEQMDLTDIYGPFYSAATQYTLFSSAPGMFFRVHNVLGHKSGSPRGDQLMPKFLVGQQCLWCLAGPWCYALWEMFMMAEEFIGLGVICRWLLNSTWMWNFLTQTSPRWFWPSRFLSIGDANKSLIIRILYVNCASFSV